MTINFNGINITPEQLAEMQRQQREQQQRQVQQMLDEKRCVLCENTYLLNDQIYICTIKNECVDNENGLDCKDWEPINIKVGDEI